MRNFIILYIKKYLKNEKNHSKNSLPERRKTNNKYLSFYYLFLRLTQKKGKISHFLKNKII